MHSFMINKPKFKNLFQESTGWAQRNQLHVLSATSLTNTDCQSRIPGWNHFIYAQTLCVLAAPGNRICDSGNPLIAAGQIVGKYCVL